MTTITVQGSFTAWYPAERAVVNLTIGFDGPEREGVFASTTGAVQLVTESIKALHDPSAGPVTWWSSDRIRVWSQRPWNKDGKQLAPVHHAAIGVTAKFRDFDALAEWLPTTALIPGVQVGGIEWTLTDATRVSATTEVRSRAVRDAADKARVFAQAIGVQNVTAVAIADPGMLGVSGHGIVSSPAMLRAGAAQGGVEGLLDFTPEDIKVESSVDARFETS